MMRPAVLAFAWTVGTATLAPAASSAPTSLRVVDAAVRHATAARASLLGPAALRFGRSIGSPNEGRLVGGTRLEETSYLRVLPAYAAGDVRWGLEPLVTLIERAARGVHREFGDAVTCVGHLSRAGGGDLERHRSHESGRDADLCFFVRGASGHPLVESRFVAFRGDGTAVGWPGAYFDDARNWALVAALVSDPEARVTHLFVSTPLRARLLAYAERVGADAAVRLRAAEVMLQPRGVQPHDDHFHVRIGCPAHMEGCVENPTLLAGHSTSLSAGRGRRGGALSVPVTAVPKRPGERGASPAEGSHPVPDDLRSAPIVLPGVPLPGAPLESSDDDEG